MAEAAAVVLDAVQVMAAQEIDVITILSLVLIPLAALPGLRERYGQTRGMYR